LVSNNELVSIVIPVYNSEKFLIQSIESALNQTYNNVEIFAVDDGSTDDSLNILKQFSDKIKIISQTHQGLAAALNAAIKKINGNWFKWLSPDDVLYPKAIEVLVDEAKKIPENTIVYSNWEIIDENDKKLRNFSEQNYNNLKVFDFNVRLFDGQQINVNTTLIPSFLFEKGCLIQDLKDPVAIDYDFFLRAGILHDIKFHLVTKSLLKYRVHPNQLSHSTIKNSLDYLSTVRNQVLSKLDNSKKEEYQVALKKFQKEKPFTKKTMELGLKIASNALPESITDKLLLFYLNKIRRAR